MTKWDSSQGCKDGTIFANQQTNVGEDAEKRESYVFMWFWD